MDKCPICGKAVSVYHEVSVTRPFTHYDNFDGIMIYGTFSSEKQTICHENNYLHFAFCDENGKLGEHRLVKLGVRFSKTQRPSQEYHKAIKQAEKDAESEGIKTLYSQTTTTMNINDSPLDQNFIPNTLF